MITELIKRWLVISQAELNGLHADSQTFETLKEARAFAKEQLEEVGDTYFVAEIQRVFKNVPKEKIL